MGQTPSVTESVNKITLDVTSEVFNRHVQISTYKVDLSQAIEINGSGNKIIGNKLRQTLMIDVKSTMKTVDVAKMQDEISQDLTQKISEKYGSVLGLGGPGAVDNLRNEVSTAVSKSFTSETIQNCMNVINNEQRIVVTGNNNEVLFNDMDQAANVIVECASSKISDTLMQTKVAQSVDQAVEKESAGFSFIKNLPLILGSIGGILAFIIILVLMIKFMPLLFGRSSYGSVPLNGSMVIPYVVPPSYGSIAPKSKGMFFRKK